MPETIVQKTCSKCNVTKPLTEFFRNNSQKSGYRADCKTCHLISQKRTAHTPERLKYRKDYRKTEAARISIQRYYRTDKGKALQKRQYLKHRDRHRARNNVCCAVRDGKMIAAKHMNCVKCGKQAAQYHHHLGYEREYWFSVLPVCLSCHTLLHPKLTCSNVY